MVLIMVKRKTGRPETPIEDSPEALDVLLQLILGHDRATAIGAKTGKRQATIFKQLERLEKEKWVKKKGPIYTINEERLIEYFASAGINREILNDHFRTWFKEFGMFGKDLGARRYNPALKDIVLYFKINEKLMGGFQGPLLKIFKEMAASIKKSDFK